MKRILLFTLFVFSGLFLSCSREEPFVAPVPPPPEINVVINEVYSRGNDANPDWIEIFNPSLAQKDLSGYKIYDSGGQAGSKPKKEFPQGTIIPAGGILVIVVDDTLDSGFGLSSSGETVWLENAASSIIDSVFFPVLGVDSSYGRMPDGATTWSIIYPATKGSKNDSTITANLPIVVNEIFSRGIATDPDWVEIYNPNQIQVNVSGYKIYDSGGQAGTKPKKEFPVGSFVPANGFLVIVVDDTASSGFGLSSGGETLWFEKPDGSLINEVQFPAMPVETTSYGRIPDGSENWLICNTITKTAPNQQ
ncbi:MAG: lamin tail domain-containing protein [Ignavibacteriaceae bacterium]